MSALMLLVLGASLCETSHAPSFVSQNHLERMPVRSALNFSQAKIKNEASNRRLLCMLCQSTCQLMPPRTLLAVKPLYPPAGQRATQRFCSTPHTTGDVIQANCCADVQRKLELTLIEQGALKRSIKRLESVLGEVLNTLTSADDLAVLERQTCAIIVYNENLTAPRKLRLLRSEIQRVSSKYSI